MLNVQLRSFYFIIRHWVIDIMILNWRLCRALASALGIFSSGTFVFIYDATMHGAETPPCPPRGGNRTGLAFFASQKFVFIRTSFVIFKLANFQIFKFIRTSFLHPLQRPENGGEANA
jgi:hypothetical protein